LLSRGRAGIIVLFVGTQQLVGKSQVTFESAGIVILGFFMVGFIGVIAVLGGRFIQKIRKILCFFCQLQFPFSSPARLDVKSMLMSVLEKRLLSKIAGGETLKQRKNFRLARSLSRGERTLP